MDHNKTQWQTTQCPHCKQHQKRTYMHKLFECKTFQQNRRSILESIYTELEHLQIHPQALMDHTINNIVLDGSYDGTIPTAHWSTLAQLLLGITPIDITHLPNYKQLQIRKMLRSHLILLHLLPQIQNKRTPEIHQGTLTIQTNNQPYNQEDSKDEEKQPLEDNTWTIDTRETEKGKIIITQQTHNNTIIRNIRPHIQQMTLEQLEAYNIGFGTANTRTAIQTFILIQ